MLWLRSRSLQIDRECPYFTVDLSEIESIAMMLNWKLIEAKLPEPKASGGYVGPAVVSRIRPRGEAALHNDGDTLI